MKRFISVILATVLLFSFAAAGADDLGYWNGLYNDNNEKYIINKEMLYGVIKDGTNNEVRANVIITKIDNEPRMCFELYNDKYGIVKNNKKGYSITILGDKDRFFLTKDGIINDEDDRIYLKDDDKGKDTNDIISRININEYLLLSFNDRKGIEYHIILYSTDFTNAYQWLMSDEVELNNDNKENEISNSVEEDNKKSEIKQVIVPMGTYLIGVDIPQGKWTIKPKTRGISIVIGNEIENNGITIKDNKERKYATIERDGSVNWELKEGYYISINYGDAVFTPYKGLGFD